MIGQRFGHLVVLRDSGIRKYGAVYWECKCDCGNITNVRSSRLKEGNTKSCGCYQYIRPSGILRNRKTPSPIPFSKIGLSFNRLTIIDIKQELRKPTKAICKCNCGNI